MKTIIFQHAAMKDFDALPQEALTQVMDALTGYAIDGRGDIKRLAGQLASGFE